LQTYELDANGHVINKATETVTIPTDIHGLLLTSYKAEENHYLTSGSSLERALEALDNAIHGVQDNVNTNQSNCAKDIEDL
jgi:predicted nucleotide-binding protein